MLPNMCKRISHMRKVSIFPPNIKFFHQYFFWKCSDIKIKSSLRFFFYEVEIHIFYSKNFRNFLKTKSGGGEGEGGNSIFNSCKIQSDMLFSCGVKSFIFIKLLARYYFQIYITFLTKLKKKNIHERTNLIADNIIQ